MDYTDYYAILAVPRTATQAEIKKAFRKLARQSHPDLRPGDKAAEQRFKDVNEANEVLSDPAKRRQYDELGANWEAFGRSGAPGGGGSGGPFGAGRTGGTAGGVRYEFRGGDGGQFSDFFHTFFGGARSSPGEARQRGARAGAATADVPVDDLFSQLSGSRSGAWGTEPGHGRNAAAETEADVTLEEAYHGTTRLVDVDGKRLEVKLPPGVDTGSRVRLKGKGGGAGSAARDLHIVVRVAPHRDFTRSGPELARELTIPLRDALLGGEVRVPTLKGALLLRIPPGTQNGRTFRLAGQGMPRLGREGSGDLLVRVRVAVPRLSTEEQRAAADAFLATVGDEEQAE